MFDKDSDRKGTVKEIGRESQGAGGQDQLIDNKQPVVK
jgi:hypothetical protein